MKLENPFAVFSQKDTLFNEAVVGIMNSFFIEFQANNDVPL
jgi:hypothetical protein